MASKAGLPSLCNAKNKAQAPAQASKAGKGQRKRASKSFMAGWP
jgi:hypothetical protein